MSRSKLHVIVVGGGIGGLCLAQGLKRNGISVAVYERDRSPDARLQGYRLNIEPKGSEALHACLPPELWDVFVATAGDPGPRMNVFDEPLRELMQEDEAGAVADPVLAHHAVSRTTLRRLLLTGLEDVVHFDKEFLRYEISSKAVFKKRDILVTFMTNEGAIVAPRALGSAANNWRCKQRDVGKLWTRSR